jgi:hypothetical protein
VHIIAFLRSPGKLSPMSWVRCVAPIVIPHNSRIRWSIT